MIDKNNDYYNSPYYCKRCNTNYGKKFFDEHMLLVHGVKKND